MTTRNVIGSLVAFILLTPGYWLIGQTAFPLEPVLTRVYSFDILKELSKLGVQGKVISGMRSSGDNVFFFVRETANDTSDTALVRTDHRGRLQYAERLGLIDVIDWRVFGDLTVAIVSEPLEGGPAELRQYDSSGRNVKASAVRRDIKYPATSMFAPLKLLRSGAVVNPSSAGLAVSRVNLKQQNRFATTAVGLPENRIALIDGVEADITFVDLKTGHITVRSINHPEINRVKSTYEPVPPGAQGLTIIASAADNEGNVYLMLSGFRASEGAPIIKIDSDGQIKQLFRCPVVPVLGAEAIVPAFLAVTDDEVFVSDLKGAILVFANDIR